MKKTKVKKVIEETRKWRPLRPDDIQYIIELANEHPRWGVPRIFEEALKPRMRKCLIIPLTLKMDTALKKATKTYQISVADVCYHILQEWLKAKNVTVEDSFRSCV